MSIDSAGSNKKENKKKKKEAQNANIPFDLNEIDKVVYDSIEDIAKNSPQSGSTLRSKRHEEFITPKAIRMIFINYFKISSLVKSELIKFFYAETCIFES